MQKPKTETKGVPFRGGLLPSLLFGCPAAAVAVVFVLRCVAKFRANEVVRK